MVPSHIIPDCAQGLWNANNPAAEDDLNPYTYDPYNITWTQGGNLFENGGGCSSVVDYLDPQELDCQQNEKGMMTTRGSSGAATGRSEKIVPHENDVLMGRGGKNNQHVGNEKLRSLARGQSENYRMSSKKGKSFISRELVSQVRQMNPAGRFLKKQANGEWVDVGDEVAREKASQVLRDAVAVCAALATTESSTEQDLDKTMERMSDGEHRRSSSAPPDLQNKRRNRRDWEQQQQQEELISVHEQTDLEPQPYNTERSASMPIPEQPSSHTQPVTPGSMPTATKRRRFYDSAWSHWENQQSHQYSQYQRYPPPQNHPYQAHQQEYFQDYQHGSFHQSQHQQYGYYHQHTHPQQFQEHHRHYHNPQQQMGYGESQPTQPLPQGFNRSAREGPPPDQPISHPPRPAPVARQPSGNDSLQTDFDLFNGELLETVDQESKQQAQQDLTSGSNNLRNSGSF